MKKISLIIFLAILCTSQILHAQSYTWAYNMGGADNDVATKVVTDASGNIYVAGYFNVTAVFGGVSVNSAGSKDGFLVKYNSAGSCMWATHIGGTGNDECTALCVDSTGNIIVAGIFASPSLNTGAGVLTNSGGDDIFFIKFSTLGAPLNSAKAGGSGYEKCIDMCIDGTGNLYTTGYIAGNGTICNFDGYILSGTGVSSMFITKYNTSLTAQWATKAGGYTANGNVRGTCVAVNTIGEAVVAGPFLYGADFIIQQFTAIGNTDMFFAKYNANGTLNAAYQFYGTTAGSRINPFDMEIDGSGFYSICGTFNVNAILGSTTLTSAGLDDIFITRINNVGNVQWAASAGSTGDDRAYGLCLDNLSNAYLTGSIDGNVIFGASTAVGHTGTPDLVIAKYSVLTNNWLWAISGGGPFGYEIGNDVAALGTSALVVVGQSDAAFALGSNNVLNAGFNDGFFTSVSLIAGIASNDLNDRQLVYPNPASDFINVSAFNGQQDGNVKLFSPMGQLVFEGNGSAKIDISQLPSAIYTVEINFGSQLSRQRFIKL